MRSFIVAIFLACSHHTQSGLFVEASEQVFVDVFANESFRIRTLDVAVETAAGAAALFLQNPMDAHDFASVKKVTKTVFAELAARGTQTIAGQRIRAREAQLESFYELLPKNEHGRLSNGTVLYAMHRLFTDTKGWSIKGLEPGSEGWLATMSVTSDVRQTSKYLVPTFVHSLLLAETNGKGLDLSLLAVLAATIDHLVHAELLQMMHNVHTTLRLPTAGVKTHEDTLNILSTFLMAYAFGVNLEVSDFDDISNARQYLDSHHAGWKEMADLINAAKREVLTSPDVLPDFGTLVQIATEVGNRYMEWQRRHCSYAKAELEAIATKSGLIAAGRLPLAEMPSELERSRVMFGESEESLRRMGVLDESIQDQPQVVIQNYLTSHSMCLTTSTYYAVCCPDECRPILKLAEVGGPSAAPSRILELLTTMKAEADPVAFTLEALQTVASPTGGKVAVYGRDFSQWLHKAFPRRCPAPSATSLSSPRTPDEWMIEEGTKVSDLETLMDQMTAAIARYTSMGASLADKTQMQQESETPHFYGRGVELIMSQERLLSDGVALEPQPRRAGMLRTAIHCALMLSMIVFAFAAWRSGLRTCKGHDDMKKSISSSFEWA